MLQVAHPSILPYDENILTCKLINLQIKAVMQDIIQELGKEILVELQSALFIEKGSAKAKSTMLKDQKIGWVNNWCVVLIMCICTEALQVASDAHAVGVLRKNERLEQPRHELYHG